MPREAFGITPVYSMFDEHSVRSNPTTIAQGVLLDRFLNNTGLVTGIVTEDKQAQEYLANLQPTLDSMDFHQSTACAVLLLDGISTEDDFWTVDRREAALILLQKLPYPKVGQVTLFRKYLECVGKHNRLSYPFGSIESTIKAGTILFPFFDQSPENVRILKERFNKTLSQVDEGRVEEGLSEDVMIPLYSQTDSIIREFTLQRDKTQRFAKKVVKGWEKPNFEPSQEELYEIIIDRTRKGEGLKLPLWDSVPEYRDIAAGLGVHVDRLWNITDPERTITALDALRENELAQKTLTLRVLQKIGTGFSRISLEHIRVVSDQVVEAAKSASEDLLPISFDDKINELLTILGTSNDKIEASEVISFLQIYFGMEIADIQRMRTMLTSQVILNSMRTDYERNEKEKVVARSFLEKAFDLGNGQEKYSLLARERSDLEIGDAMNTAYAFHSSKGKKANTVPGRLLHPGYNSLQVRIGEYSPAISLSYVVGIAEGQPVLVVDEILIKQDQLNLPLAQLQSESQTALEFLQQYAERAGIATVLINRSLQGKTNIEQQVLRGLSLNSPQQPVTELHLLRGYDGVIEARERLSNQITGQYDSLLSLESQSKQDSKDQNETSKQKLFKQFSSFLEKLSIVLSTEYGEEVQSAIEAQDWRSLFRMTMQYRFPYLARDTFEWNYYARALEKITRSPQNEDVDDEFSNWFSDSLFKTKAPASIIKTVVAMNVLEINIEESLPANFQTIKSILATLFTMSKYDLSPEDAIGLFNKSNKEALLKGEHPMLLKSKNLYVLM